jgi:hypothetical protein
MNEEKFELLRQAKEKIVKLRKKELEASFNQSFSEHYRFHAGGTAHGLRLVIDIIDVMLREHEKESKDSAWVTGA